MINKFASRRQKKINNFADSSIRCCEFQWNFFFRCKIAFDDDLKINIVKLTQQWRKKYEMRSKHLNKKKTQRSITIINVKILMLTEFRKINQIFFEILNVFRYQINFFWIFLLMLWRGHIRLFVNFRQADDAKFNSITKFKRKHIFFETETLKIEIMFIFLWFNSVLFSQIQKRWWNQTVYENYWRLFLLKIIFL